MSKINKGWDGKFADPEVGRVLHANGLIANANKSSIEELATITSLNPRGSYNTGYFYNNKVITQFPELKYFTGLTSLYAALYGCSKLTEAPIIPEGVIDMNRTFYGCSSLDGIFIIKPVTPPTYSSTFTNTKVVTIYVPDESVSTYKSRTGWSNNSSKIFPMSYMEGDIFFEDPEVGRVLKANGLIADATRSSIEELATITTLNPDSSFTNKAYFYNNKVITKFPELKYFTGLRGLFGAFGFCSNLTETPIIPDSVTDMDNAFGGCSSLTEAPTIPRRVSSMRETFNGCTSLDGIFVLKPFSPPTSIVAFTNTEVVAIYVPDESVDRYKTNSRWSRFADKIYPMSQYWDGKFADPEVGRVLHANGLIANANKSSIEELGTITSLNPSGSSSGSYFYNNKVITKFPELKYFTGLTDLIYTFNYCSSLTIAPVIPSNVTSLSWTFYGCSSLATAPIIPEGVTSLNETFYECSSIDGIYIINIVTPVSYSNSLENVQAIYVPDESVQLYKEASGWSDFAYKRYPMSEHTFEVSGIFADPEVGRVLHANGLIADATRSSIEELATIKSLNPSGYVNTGYFYNNTKITQFPELKYCTGLTDLFYVFYNCTNLTEVVLPNSVTTLQSTFRSCTSLATAPDIPSSVTDMEGTFYGCSNLTTAPIIPSNVTSLAETFRSCTSLATAPIIPESVTNMRHTFYECSGTDGIYIIEAKSPPSVRAIVNNRWTTFPPFESETLVAIYVPDASVNTYKSASGWSSYSDKIKPKSTKP